MIYQRQRALLCRAVCRIIVAAEYQSVTRAAIDTLVDAVHQYLLALARIVHDYGEHSGRNIASLHDFWMAAIAQRIHNRPLLNFAIDHFSQIEREIVCKEEERAVIGKQTPALLFEEDKPEPLPPFIPAYMPDFPARHSYKTTNFYQCAEQNAGKLRETLTRQNQRLHDNLKCFLKRSQNPLVVLLEDEEEKQQVGTELGHSDQTIQVGRDAHKFRAVTTAGGGGSRCRQIIHNTIINKDYKVAATSSQTIIDPGPPDLLAESELNAESGVTFQLSTQAALAASYAGPAPIQRRIIHPIARYHPISSATTNDDQYDQLNVDYYQAASSVIEYLCTAGHPLDHPLCQECAETITARLSQQLEDIELECCLCEEQLPNDSTDHSVALANSESEATAEEIVELRETEGKLIERLSGLESQVNCLERELTKLNAESKELDRLEESFWQESNQIQLQNIKRCEEWQSMDLRTRYTAAHLERLKHSNVINDAFHIWHDGPFGTINGFRLGRIPDWPVDWGEINAALGQACLLLQILADRCQFVFHVYRLIPLGNYSRIEKLSDDKAVYELYGSGEFQISRLFWNRRFDLALVAFLNCVQQLAEYAERMDKTFKLPYSINKDKIGEASIKTQFSQDETWTRALKYLLTDLKWLLAFCSDNSNKI